MPSTNPTAAPTMKKMLLPEGAIVTRVTEDRIYFIRRSHGDHAILHGLQAEYREMWITR
jgi:hypothetical protein